MEEAAATWTETSGVPVHISPASSSLVVRQLESGVDADLALLASTEWADALETGPVPVAERQPLLGNALVVIGAPGTTPPRFDGAFPDHLGDCLALGDPSYVPGGIYAKQALESLGVWELVADRVAPALDAPAAVALVARSQCSVGLVYATDANSATVEVGERVDESAHPPIVYPLLVLGEPPSDEARAFATWLRTPAGRDLFSRYGFGTP